MNKCMKTITITDDVYEALRIRKGHKSFSEVIRELLKRASSGNAWIDEIFGSARDIDVNAIVEARRTWRTRSY